MLRIIKKKEEFNRACGRLSRRIGPGCCIVQAKAEETGDRDQKSRCKARKRTARHETPKTVLPAPLFFDAAKAPENLAASWGFCVLPLCA